MRLDRVQGFHKSSTGMVLSLALAVGAMTSARVAVNGVASRGSLPQETGALLQRIAGLPLSFERNEGQVGDDVRLASRGAGYGLYLTPQRAVLALAPAGRNGADERAARGVAVGMRLAGSNPNPAIQGVDSLPGKLNYFLGNDA